MTYFEGRKKQTGSYAAKPAVRVLCLALLTVLFLLSGLFALLRVRAEEPETPASPSMVLPQNSYVSLKNPKDLYVDAGQDLESAADDVLYILDAKYAGSPAKVIVCKDGKVISEVELPASFNPISMRGGAGKLFLYDDDERLIQMIGTESLLILPQDPLLANVNCKGMTVSGSVLYVSAGSSIRAFDFSQASGVTELTRPVTGLNSASNLAAYQSGGSSMMLFADECSPRYGILSAAVASGIVNHLNCNTFFSKPMSIAAGNSLAFIGSGDGIYTMNLAGGKPGEIISAQRVDSGADADAGTVLQPTAMQFIPGLNHLYVVDNIAKSVQRFRVDAAGKFDYDGLCLSSFGSALGRLNIPSDAAAQDKGLYILDTGNSRIQSYAGGIPSAVSFSDAGIVGRAEHIAADGERNLYVSSGSNLYIIGAEGKLLATASAQNTISALSATDSGVLFADGSEIKKVGSDGAVSSVAAVTPGTAIVSFAPDLKGEAFFYATAEGIYRKSLKGSESLFFPLTDIADLDIDFQDTLLVLTAQGIVKLRFDGAAFAAENANVDLRSVAGDGRKLPVAAPSSIALDKTSGEVVLTYPNDHLVAKFDKGVLDAATYLDIPQDLVPPLQILDRKANDGNTRTAKIAGWPSTILYPVRDALANTDTYPKNFCFTESDGIQLLETGTEVLVLSEAKGYYYILYQNKSGFILQNSVSFPTAEKPPYSSAQVLHDRANVYKFPSSVKNGEDYAFKAAELTKNAKLTLLDDAAGFSDAAGTLWYRVQYGDSEYGYIARDNVTQFLEWELPSTQKYGKIKADVAHGTVQVYTDEEHFTLFKDGVRVQILKEENGKVYIKGQDANGQTIQGYVDKKFITFDPLTTSQIVGICLLCSVGVLLIAALILYKIFKSRAKVKIKETAAKPASK